MRPRMTAILAASLLLGAAGFVHAGDAPAAGSAEEAAVSVPERESEPEATQRREDASATQDAKAAKVASAAPEKKPDAESDATQAAPQQTGPKALSGMSILGNQEAPKSLVLVPWKSSVLGDSMGIATMLDDSKQPVDRDVFLRSLGYYEIRSEKTP